MVFVVIVPMVNDVDEARRAAAACKFPPVGARSYGTTRTSMFLGGDTEHVNREVMCLAMIETRTAVANVDAICNFTGTVRDESRRPLGWPFEVVVDRAGRRADLSRIGPFTTVGSD